MEVISSDEYAVESHQSHLGRAIIMKSASIIMLTFSSP